MPDSDREPPVLSMRTRVPLLVGAVIVAVSIAMGWTSYREVRRVALESAEARLRAVVAQLVPFLMAQREATARAVDSLTTNPQVALALRRGEPPGPASIDRLERWLEAQPGTLGAELWAQNEARVYAAGDGPRAEGRPPAAPQGAPSVGITPLRVINDTVFYQATYPVTENGDTVGFFTHTTRLSGSPDARSQFRALTGMDGRLLVGSAESGVWYDQATAVSPPPLDPSDTGLVRYQVDGNEQLAIAEPLPDRPWTLAVEFANDSALANTRAFLMRLLVAGGLVTVLGILGGWAMSRRLTAPLERLTAAVKEFATGNRAARVDIERRDELGQLGRAFNTMATQVGEQQSELARANETLSRSEQRFQLVALGTLDGLWDWNIEQGTTFYSPRFRDLMDYKVSGNFQDTLRANLHPEDRRAVLDAINGHLERREPLDVEARFVSSAGGLRWFRIRGQAVWAGDGNAQRLAGSIIEFTRRRQAEKEVRQLNAALERRVEERTAALTAANTELEAFTYSVSHDLRAPLRQANGFAQLLAEEYGPQLPEDARHYVQRIQDSATRMSSLVDDLLRLSRVSRQRLDAKHVDVSAIVEAVRSDLPDEDAQRMLEWRIGPLPTVTGDPTLLRQVFVNLLHNAVKYTRPRDRAIIEVGSTAATRETIFHVKDNGVGFDPNYADRLFGVFQRLHRAEEFEGTGVGLAIVQRIIHRHGGRVWAESTPEEGATFYFALPATEAVPNAPQTV
jgi:signal transduction histidine kinase